jgi:ribosome biogenesis GTPase A
MMINTSKNYLTSVAKYHLNISNYYRLRTFFTIVVAHNRKAQQQVEITDRQRRVQQVLFRIGCSNPICLQQQRTIGNRTIKAPIQRERDDEEYHAGRALRFMQENQPNIVVNVENVRLSAIKLLPRVAEAVIQSTPIRIKVLTHVDTISDAALRQQIQTVQQLDERIRYPNQLPVAIFALNLQTVDIKARELSEVRDALFGASRLVTKPQMLVCGIPNSGKSSLIYPLTRHRTVQEKKKGAYHLPKVSSKAGMTLGVKKHLLPPAFGSFIKYNITMIDMPGFRPKLQYADPSLVALLLSAGVTEPFQGYKTIAPHDTLVKNLLKATNRHATMTDRNSLPDYVQLLNLTEPTESPETFMSEYLRWAKNNEDARLHVPGHSANIESIYWPRTFNSGVFGGLIFTPYPTLPHPSHSSHIVLDRESPVVYMNEEAERLMNIGLGKEPATKIEERSKDKSSSLNGKPGDELDPNRILHPVVYPPHQRSFKCMQCAQFVKLDAGGKVYGRRHGRAVDWSYADLLAYFSRMTEVFGGMWSKRTRYLMKDSLVCTLAIKHKLRSRAGAYKKFKGLKDYPVPNHLRPKRFQIDQPIPYVHFCTRKVGSCRTMTEEEVRKEIGRLECCNVTDHTFQLQRARGVPVRAKKRKKPRKIKLGPDGFPLKPPSVVAKQCIVQTVGPLSAVPRYDSKGNELYPKKRRKAEDY